MFRKNTSIRILGIFTLVILTSSVTLIAWGRIYVKRINKLKDHISSIQNNRLDEVYLDSGKDELSELSLSVESMRETIAKNEKTKQEMLQNLSHDIKTPIAVIKTYTEAIRDGMSDSDSTEVILKQTDILQHKITKLLQYNKLEYLTKNEPFVEVNMKEIIESVANNYKFQKNVKIELNLKDVIYRGYLENYYVVVENILDNAKRYAKSKIVITLNDDELSFFNDGDPIDTKFINSNFKPYEKGSHGQFGLGMSIVEKTLDFFGYYIKAKNLDNGVIFIIKKRD
jgi:two-component system sensor histidine kinase CssS